MIKESTETYTVYPVHISKVFLRYLTAFQNFVSKLRFKNLNEKDAKSLYQELLAFKNFNFATNILSKLKDYLDKIHISKEIVKTIQIGNSDHIKSSFLKGNYESVYNDALKLRSSILLFLKSVQDSTSETSVISNLSKSSASSFFSRWAKNRIVIFLRSRND